MFSLTGLGIMKPENKLQRPEKKAMSMDDICGPDVRAKNIIPHNEKWRRYMKVKYMNQKNLSASQLKPSIKKRNRLYRTLCTAT